MPLVPPVISATELCVVIRDPLNFDVAEGKETQVVICPLLNGAAGQTGC
jgi:hypothetical protein